MDTFSLHCLEDEWHCPILGVTSVSPRSPKRDDAVTITLNISEFRNYSHVLVMKPEFATMMEELGFSINTNGLKRVQSEDGCWYYVKPYSHHIVLSPDLQKVSQGILLRRLQGDLIDSRFTSDMMEDFAGLSGWMNASNDSPGFQIRRAAFITIFGWKMDDYFSSYSAPKLPEIEEFIAKQGWVRKA